MNPNQPYPNTSYPQNQYPSQTYAQQAYPSTAGNASTTTTQVQSTRTVVLSPFFDIQYLRTIPGWLKIAQLILMLIAFILAAAAWSSSSYWCPGLSNTYCYNSYTTGSAGWAKFVTITGFIITLILLNLYLFHLIEKLYQVNWLFVEFIYCVVVTVCLFIAGCVMIPTYGTYDGTRGAVVFFCWAAMAAYGYDAFLKFKAWRNGEVAQGVSATVTTSTSAPARPPPYPVV
ncbi:hypothetical protein BV898_01356 [Hypsibius exemplaris]|uniref:MARVEL domain-containing protein n=1 Tax=Hypsibius exemplaris TaxID=2072580 RepID=A0A1W0XB76_HYPEX|nr:hypothetical protein BV898_01356 [Hypsibius exemplaris]